MSKTLETKKKIVEILRSRQMTASGLSRELGLTEATISQHLGELRMMGTIERIDNEHFRKLKYYKVKEAQNPMLKYIAGLAIILALASALFITFNRPVGTPGGPGTPYVSGQNPGALSIASTGAACPMLFYTARGSVYNYSGSFSLHYVNTTSGPIPDYVIPHGSGMLYASEFISNVLSEPQGFNYTRQHSFAILQPDSGQAADFAQIINVSVTPKTFTLKSNETVSVSLEVTVLNGTAGKTYLLFIDGPCEGVQPVLLTVGNAPYSGKANSTWQGTIS